MSLIAAATFITVAALFGVWVGRHVEDRLQERRRNAYQRTINGLINTAAVRNRMLADVAWGLEVYETSGDTHRLIYAARQSVNKTQEPNR